jgi:signal transduction histidine kinase
VAPGYVLGTLTVMTGYFPIRRAQGQPVSVLVLEAGQMFVAAAGRIAHARTVAILLALLFAAALAVITARWTRAERERRQAGTRAARGELLSRLAAMAAHEIRNPLGVIRGTVELMLERSAATLTERDHVALGDINDEVERLRRLTQDLLSLASDKPLSADPLAVGDLLADVARATEAAFPAVKIRCDIGPLPVVDADGGLLRQALLNLLGNAAQAQGTGDVKLRAATHGDTIRIAIQDQGPGVPPDVGDRIFDLYFTTKSGGTGLGLAIARRIAERHGGRLSLAPTPGPGATFVLDLPVRSPVRDRDDNDRPEKG